MSCIYLKARKLLSFSVLELPYGRALITTWKEKSQGVCFMFPTRAWAGAAQETPEELHYQDDEHQEPVEKHCGAVCQLVSVLRLWPGLYSFFANQSQHPLYWEHELYMSWSPENEDIRRPHVPCGRRMS